MEMFKRLFLFAFLMSACIGSLVFAGMLDKSYNAERDRQQELLLLQQPKTIEERSVDAVNDTASDAMTALVAVAVSGDIAQAKIAGYIPQTIWGFGLVMLSIAVIITVISLKKDSKQVKITRFQPEAREEFYTNKN
jgi:hypothetical protein